MKINQFSWTKSQGWNVPPEPQNQVNLVLVFAETDYFFDPACYQDLHRFFPSAHIAGVSTAGNISGTDITDDSISICTVSFDRANVKLFKVNPKDGQETKQLVAELMEKIKTPDLRHLFVITGGLAVDGTKLSEGLCAIDTPVTGGLAGDGPRFIRTGVMADGATEENCIAVLAFYGDLEIHSGFSTGWVEFGIERVVTRSVGSTVFELDHAPALETYAKYLGDMVDELPSSGLRFPLSARKDENEIPVIRTLLGINKEEQSLTFAGDIPQGSLCRLMKTDIDSLIDASGIATKKIMAEHKGHAGLTIAVSCIGRRLVLGQLSGEELEAIKNEVGQSFTMTGFYSYGELAPFNFHPCSLHNQTTSITLISE